jgi:hypothetical protein
MIPAVKLGKAVKVTNAGRWAPVWKVAGYVVEGKKRLAPITVSASGQEERLDTIGGVPVRRYDVAPYLDGTNPLSRKVPVRGTWKVKATAQGNNAVAVVLSRRLGRRVELQLSASYPLSTGGNPYAGSVPELPRWRWAIVPGSALAITQAPEEGEADTYGAALWRAWTRAVEILAADGGARASQRIPAAGLPADEEVWLPARVDRLRLAEPDAPRARSIPAKKAPQGALFGG